jgi:hypothetical protein
MSRELAEIPSNCFREQVFPFDLRTRWADFPEMIEMLDEFMSAMQSGDELWLFDYGSWTGLAIRRADVAVKNRLYLHGLRG